MAANQWTRVEDKLFEQALVIFPEESPDRWERIAERLQKSAAEVRDHYEALVHDVLEIDSGRVDVPDYVDDSAVSWDSASQISFGTKHGESERKKGTPWTEAEHKLFLIGLKQYGKGDWRSISRNVVVSRTPTQVASHAQKYFLRQNSVKKERKRSSIHDITTVDSNTMAVPAPDQNWITQPANPIQPQQQPPMAEFNSQLPPPNQFTGQGQGHSLGFPANFGFPM